MNHIHTAEAEPASDGVSWPVLRLKHVARLAYGDSLSTDARVDGDIPVFGSNGVVGNHDRANMHAPAIVVGRKGSFGKVTFAPDGGFAIDTTYFVDCRNTAANIRWLYHSLSTLGLDEVSQDTGVPGLSREKAYEARIPVPPLPTQKAIAAYLDRKTAAIDTLIEKKEKLIALLAEKRAALINRAVTKGLNPDVPMKDSGVPWIGEIPTHWQVKRLKYFSPEVSVGIVITPSKYYVDHGVPALRSLNVKERGLTNDDMVYISDESNEVLAKSQLHSEDLVAVRTGQPGTTAVVDLRFDGANCIDLIIIRRPIGGNPAFLCYVMNSGVTKGQYQAGATGAIQQHFNIETAKDLILAVPSEVEQNEIVAFLISVLQKFDGAGDALATSVQRLREYRQALITAAVTGQIDVVSEVTE